MLGFSVDRGIAGVVRIRVSRGSRGLNLWIFEFFTSFEKFEGFLRAFSGGWGGC